MKKLHRKFLGSVVLMLWLTGAVRGSQGAATVSEVCSLITRQEAATAFGAPVPAGAEKSMDLPVKGSSPIKMQSCFYGSGVVVARYELGTGAPVLFGKYRQEFASQPDLTDYQNVNGIGDEAFAAKGQLMVRKGQTGLLIGVGDSRGVRGGAKELQAEKALAVLALGRS